MKEAQINGIELLDWLKQKRNILKAQGSSERYIGQLVEIIEKVACMIGESREINLYDEVETYPNCTVQILRNSVTGDVSIGWVRNE